jgi:hypothetical protein
VAETGGEACKTSFGEVGSEKVERWERAEGHLLRRSLATVPLLICTLRLFYIVRLADGEAMTVGERVSCGVEGDDAVGNGSAGDSIAGYSRLESGSGTRAPAAEAVWAHRRWQHCLSAVAMASEDEATRRQEMVTS